LSHEKQDKKEKVDRFGHTFYFEDYTYFPNGRLAQLVEHLTFNQGVIGSIPIAPTITPWWFPTNQKAPHFPWVYCGHALE
jgi:hypothetical protein